MPRKKTQSPQEAEAALEYLRRLKADKNLFFEHCLKLKNFGSGELVPFKLNEVQVILHHMCERMLEEEEHVRIIVLKARRFGISSYVQGRFFHNVVMNFNKLCQIATHSKGATDSMFAMTKIFEENYPEQIKPSKRYSGKRELVFGAETGGLNSEYSLCTVGGKEVRGSQIDFLHCSEVASWGEHGDDYFLGLLNCVIAGYGTEVIVESTASGVGGLFYDLWVDAVEGSSGFKDAFFPWFIYSYYQKAFKSEQEKLRFENSLGTEKRYGGEEEKKLLGHQVSYDIGTSTPLEFEVSLENLQWRRTYIDTQCQGDLLKFHQEYPSHWREAFVSTGRSVFNLESLNELVLMSESRYREKPPRCFSIPVKIYKDDNIGMKYILETDENHTELEVHRQPDPARQYRIGADVAEGIEIGRDSDYSVAVVLDAETYEECAMLRTRIDPDLFAWQLKTLGRYYEDAMILCERNNHGLVTLKYLVDIHGYPNVYSEKILDERSQRSAKKIGFHTTVKSKPLIIDFLKELIREREIKLYSTILIDELQTFVNVSSGKMQAQHGCHDDCVMALAIAAFGCKMYPYMTPTPRSYSFGHPAINLFHPARI